MTSPTLKTIPGFAGYKASSSGRVYSDKPWRGKSKTRELSMFGNGTGYLQVSMRKNHRDCLVLVHRAILLAFRGECPKGHQARHIDGNKHNNQIANLAWGTPSENYKDRKRHGTELLGADNPASRLSRGDVVEIMRLFGRGVGCVEVSRKTGISHQTVSDITRGKRWGWFTGVKYNG